MQLERIGAEPRPEVTCALCAAIICVVSVLTLHAAEWYDEYYAGTAALRNHDAMKAIDCFQRAIRKRSDPGEHLVTYGTNAIDHYYPYVRLAEAQVMAGQVDAARSTLERSTSSGKEPASERSRVEALIADAAARASPAKQTETTTRELIPKRPTESPPIASATAPTSDEPESSSQADLFGTLLVDSTPPAAMVLLGGRLLGKTPLDVQLPAGSYSLLLRSDGMEDRAFPIRIRAGHKARARFTMVPIVKQPPAAGRHDAEVPERLRLVFVSDPPGATVYLDGRALGMTDPETGRLVKTDIEAGSHRLQFSLSNHMDHLEVISASRDWPNRFAVTLVALPSESPGHALTYVGIALAGGLAGLLLHQRHRRRAGRGAAAAPVEVFPIDTATPNFAARMTRVVGAPLGGAAIPETFGEYRLLSVLGKGGMAIVYKGERDGELFAVKRPLPVIMGDAESLARFVREADIGRTLHHPNIVRILDRGEVNGVPFFAMELIQGETLRALMAREGPLPPRRASQIVAQVAEALDYAHLKGVIHRDLKPSNIMLSDGERVKVMDYGIARALKLETLTDGRFLLGTADYISPEVIEGRPVDGRSDLYALGVIFYELLTGTRPFDSDTAVETIRRQRSEAPVPPTTLKPGCPKPLEAMILKLLEKTAEHRYQSADSLVVDLRDYLTEQGHGH